MEEWASREFNGSQLGAMLCKAFARSQGLEFHRWPLKVHFHNRLTFLGPGSSAAEFVGLGVRSGSTVGVRSGRRFRDSRGLGCRISEGSRVSGLSGRIF